MVQNKNEISKVKENKNEETYQKHDKMFRKLLYNKTQVVELLNRYFEFRNKLKEDIERYNCKFVNAQFKTREADIIYKLKNSNIFFQIEHQSSVDHNMTQRIAEYEIEMIKLENSKKSNSKEIVIPLIIPLIIYTGNSQKWNAHKNIIEAQPVLTGYKKRGIGSYDVLDINTLETEELLNNSIFLYRIFAIEKAKNLEELTQNLSYLISKEKDENNIVFLKEIIQYVYQKTLKQKDIQEFFEQGEEGEGKMNVVERVLKQQNDLITKERKEGKREGKREGIEMITIEMLRQDLDDKFIMQITKMDANTLDKIKRKRKSLKK